MRPTGHPSGSRRLAILVVEDDQDHAALIEAVFHYRDLPCSFHVTGSSEEAMDYLLGRWPFADRERHPLPDVIILDIVLPGMDGLGFMGWLRTREEPWAQTPVVVLTSIHDRGVAARARELGAREVKLKPSDFGDLVDAVAALVENWRADTA